MEEFPTVRCIECGISRNLLQIPVIQKGKLIGQVYICEDDLKVKQTGPKQRVTIKFENVEEEYDNGEAEHSDTNDGRERPAETREPSSGKESG